MNQEVNLQKNADGSSTEASIYLREEAQLIQGSTGKTENSGNGLLSVFQEGTSNAYDYNYWSAPVGTGVSGNGLFGIKMLSSPISQTKSRQAEATTDLDGSSSPLRISSVWIHTYSGTDYSNWVSVQNRTEIPAGYGFIMKGVKGNDPTVIDGRPNNPGSSQRYDFRGLPNNGPINIPVTPGEYILIGNPFPSALDLSLFLLENSGTGVLETPCGGTITRSNKITGIAYFWDSVENGNSHYLQDYIGGYGAFSPVDPCTTGIYERPLFKSYKNSESSTSNYGEHYERRYLPIAQGFMAEGASDSELQFKNSQRIFKTEGEHSDFKKVLPVPKKELSLIPKIRLEINFNDTYTRTLSLGFWPSSTPGPDDAMDAPSFDLVPTDIGWSHNGEPYIIDVRPFVRSDEIPFYLKVENTQVHLKMGIKAVENFDLEDVFVFDSEEQRHYSLKGQDFQITLGPGMYHKRFSLKFQDKEETLPAPEIIDPEVVVVVVSFNNSLGQVEIRNTTRAPLSEVTVHDLTGKRVFYGTDFSTEFSVIPTAFLAEGVYIVKIILEDRRELVTRVLVR